MIITSFILIFILEHFGDFTHKSYGGTLGNATLVNSYFKTPFGNKIKIPNGTKAYTRHSDGTYIVQGYYSEKLPYYIKGMFSDILYTIILITILMIFYFFKNKYSIKIS